MQHLTDNEMGPTSARHAMRSVNQMHRFQVHHTWEIQEFEAQKLLGHPIVTEIGISKDDGGHLSILINLCFFKHCSSPYVKLRNPTKESFALRVDDIYILSKAGEKKRAAYTPATMGAWKMLQPCESSSTSITSYWQGSFFSDAEYMSLRNQVLTNDAIKVGFDLSIVASISSQRAPSLQHHLHSMLLSSRFSDVEFKCDGKAFKCHKSILCARSPVFDAMFRCEKMCEAQTDCIEMCDMNAITMEHFLEYMYTDDTNGLPENAVNLFYVADKYQIPALRIRCVENLTQRLACGKVGATDVLILAYLHEQHSLLLAAIDFMKNNKQLVLDSASWKSIENDYPALANRILSALLESKDG
eukprot:CAMPEP_0113944514 /NCGR_PEP_ID=MMETSP1339-20121228/34469_1 /TAXON_ID=94617 /ORGANISM="Fibrocapsa japonica" /LENGTH=357 /DNA_ID=CAMNT_0000949741 /DNA_START=62 /DNA_END=1135 /DNA_ORIENTATION=+ /assembly_acc=CAM_ASM_000762